MVERFVLEAFRVGIGPVKVGVVCKGWGAAAEVEGNVVRSFVENLIVLPRREDDVDDGECTTD